MSRILVTGGAGYVGSVCCRQLLECGHEVIVLDDLSTGHAQAVPPEATFYRLDYGDREGVAQLLRKHSVDTVFHFAAKALIAESVSNPGLFFDANVASAIVLLESLRAAGIKHFVFSSSAAVYGNPRNLPIHEDHDTSPVNSYGETKLMLEQVLRWYASAYEWAVVAFRYFNASGATDEAGENHRPETHIVPLLLEAASGERPYFEVYGEDYDTPDGTCIRDYVHVSDIAAAHLLALNAPRAGEFNAYNIGVGHGYSVRQVIRAVEDLTGKRVPVRMGKRRPGDPAVLCASPEKLKREFRWEPRSSELRNVIQTAWEWKMKSAALAA